MCRRYLGQPVAARIATHWRSNKHTGPTALKFSRVRVSDIRIHAISTAPSSCTSHVERQNLNIRTAMRRFTRLTIGFSKKWENLKAALALYFAYYNFVRVHSSIRCTPAMEAGITDRLSTMRDLLAV